MDLIDTSSKSLSIAVCICLLLMFAFKLKYNKILEQFESVFEQDPYYESKVNTVLFSTACLTTVLVLILFKQYLVTSGSQVYLDESFD